MNELIQIQGIIELIITSSETPVRKVTHNDSWNN